MGVIERLYVKAPLAFLFGPVGLVLGGLTVLSTLRNLTELPFIGILVCAIPLTAAVGAMAFVIGLSIDGTSLVIATAIEGVTTLRTIRERAKRPEAGQLDLACEGDEGGAMSTAANKGSLSEAE